MNAAIALLLFAQISNRPPAVEIVCPMPPAPVVAGGGRVLVYELHITNFGVPALALRRIEIAGIADLSGDAMAGMLRPVGQSSEAGRLETGRRLIAFLSIALPRGTALPKTLRHRFTFDIVPGDASARQSVIDGIIVPVRRDRVPVVRLPLEPGEWLAGNALSNTSDHRRAVIALDGRTWIAQRFAIDFVRIGPNGDTTHDGRATNENFWAFGQPVHAVADGEVTGVVDAYPDNEPGHTPPATVENLSGNHVILRIGRDRYALFAHLQQHSIRVRLHQHVKRGDVIGKIGNSGNTTGVHLHFQLMDRNSPLAAEGVPYVFDRFAHLGFGAEFEQDKHPNEPRDREIPVENEVIGVR